MKLFNWKSYTEKPSTVDPHTLAALLEGRELGQPQQKGRMQVIPVFGSLTPKSAFASPEKGVKMNHVHTYGVMELHNPTQKLSIAPLHMGFFQQGAQNHAMCRASILEPGKNVVFKDACCIQAAQGGYIRDLEARFIVLPHNLRKAAFDLRGVQNYGKLWEAISALNASMNLKNRGHLDELKQNFQPEMVKATCQFELLPNQTGAIILMDGQLIGIELSPDVAFYKEMHNTLVMYGYAPAKIQGDILNREFPKGLQLVIEDITTPAQLLQQLDTLEQARKAFVHKKWAEIADLKLTLSEEESVQDATMAVVNAGDFAGQAVYHKGKPAYVSLFNETAFQIA